MIRKDKLPHITSIYHKEGRVDFELAERIEVPGLGDRGKPVIFVGAFCDEVIIVIGVVDSYQVVSNTHTRLGMRGPVISYAA